MGREQQESKVNKAGIALNKNENGLIVLEWKWTGPLEHRFASIQFQQSSDKI
jgi:hypothetical protein